MVAIVSGKGLGLLNSSASVLGQNGLFGNAQFGSASEKAFVNVSNGNLVLQDRDLVFTNTGADMALTRTYNSLGNYGGALGREWAYGAASLSGLPPYPDNGFDGSMRISRTAADGSIALYTYDGARGAFTSTDGGDAYQTLRYDGSTKQWLWTGARDDRNDVYERYDTSGRLTEVWNQGGARITYGYDSAGKLSGMHVFSAPRGESPGDPMPGPWQPSPSLDSIGNDDAAGEQSSQARVMGPMYVEDDEAPGMIQATRAVQPPLDTASAEGWSIDSTTASGAHNSALKAETTSQVLYRKSYEIDKLGRLASVTTYGAPSPSIVRYTYDGQSDRIQSVTQSDGATMTIGYDSQGRVKQLVEHDNSGAPDRVSTFDYAIDSATQYSVTTVTDALKHATTYVSDALGQLRSVSIAIAGGAPIVLSYDYNARGDVVQVTDEQGRTTRYGYDAHGNRTFERHADGTTITRTYDFGSGSSGTRTSNRLLTESVFLTPADVGATTASGAALTQRYVPNSLGQVRYAISAEGRVTEFSYNGNGELQRELAYQSNAFDVSTLLPDQVPTEYTVEQWTKAAGAGTVIRTDYGYTFGRLTSTTRYELGSSTGSASNATVASHDYDRFGNLLSVKEGNVTVSSTTYDNLGRPLTQTTPNGTTVFSYEGTATSAITTDPYGIRTVQVFDSNGRLVSTTQSKGNLTQTTRNVYDAASRLRMTIDQAGRKTVYLYDDAGRKVADIGPDGAMTEYVYGVESDTQPARVIQYALKVATALLFDKDGKPGDTVTPDLVRPTATAFDRTTVRHYDQGGRILAEIDAEGYLTRNVYDNAGRLTRTISRARPVTDLQRSATTLWSIDKDPTSDLDREAVLEYNNDGQLRFKTYPLKNRTEYRYDNTGLLTDTIAYDATTGASIRQHTVYDGLRRQVANVDGDGYVKEIRYDAAGNVARRIRYATAYTAAAPLTFDVLKKGMPVSQDDRSTRYGYNALHQLETESTVDGNGVTIGQSTTYTYDTLGNVKTVKKTNGIGAQNDYDDLGRLEAETPYAGATPIRHKYDAQGRRISTTDQNGNRTLFFYDTAGRLQYTVDALGDVTERTYDTFGELAVERRYGTPIGASALALLSGGDAAGLAGLQPLMTDTRTYYFYDRDGRLQYTVNGAGEATNRQYDAFDQVVSVKRYLTALTKDTMSQLGAGTPAVGLPGPGLPPSVLTTALASIATATTRYAFDKDGRLVYTVDAENGAESRTYDGFGRTTSIRQHVVGVKGADGAPVADAADRVVVMDYDNRGNVRHYTNPATTVETNYNAFGQVLRIDRTGSFAATVDGRAAAVQAVTERRFYDKEGRLGGTIDAAGTFTVLKYDANDNITQRTVFSHPIEAKTAAGATIDSLETLVAADPSTDMRELMFYDAAGRMTAKATAASASSWSVQTIDYDAAGQSTRQTVFARPMTTQGTSLPTADAVAQWTAANATDSDAIQRLVYDGAGRQIAVATRQAGKRWTVTTQQYDASDRVILRTTYGKWIEVGTPTDADIRGAVASTNDAITAYRYDNAGRVLSTATAQSIATVNGQADGPPNAVRWAVVTNSYDAQGNLASRTGFANPIDTSTRTFDFDAAIATAAGDRTDSYRYDNNGRLKASIDGLGTATGLDYDAKGNLIRRTVYATPATGGKLPSPSSLDRVSRIVYDTNNHAAYEIDPAGGVTTREYDGFGNVARVTRYATPLTTVLADSVTASDMVKLVTTSAYDRTDRFYYDAAGRQRFAIDAAGYMTERRYDGLGHVTDALAYQVVVAGATGLADMLTKASAQQGDASLPPRMTHYQYDAQGHVLQTTDANSHVETQTYDALGNRKTLSKRADANAPWLTWNYDYDATGRLLAETTPEIDIYSTDGAKPDAGWGALAPTKGTLTTRYEYDALGNLAQRSEGATGAANRKTTAYGYDRVGRQTVTRLPDTTVYDPATDTMDAAARGLTVEVTYDVFGNATVNKDVGGNLSYKFYDKRGQVIRDVDAKNYATRYERNAFGEVETLTRYARPLAQPDASFDTVNDTNARVIKTRYDLLGRAAKVTEPTVAVNDGHMLGQISQFAAARTTASAYNAFGDLVRSDVYAGGANDAVLTEMATTQYFYDLGGVKRAQIDVNRYDNGAPRGYVTTFDEDYAGRVTRRVEYGKEVGGWKGDEWRWEQAGATPSTDATDRITSTRYDALGNKVSERIQGQNTDATTGWSYDDIGRLRSTTDAKGVKSVSYYDAAGRVSATAMIEAKVDAKQSMPMSEFRLDAYGNVAVRIDHATTVPDGADELTRPTVAFDAANDRVTVNLYDVNGRLKQTVDAENHAINYAYDVFGRVAKQSRQLNAGTAYEQTVYSISSYNKLGQLEQVRQTGNLNVLAKTVGPAVDTVQRYEYNAFGEATLSEISSGGKTLRSEETRYDNAGRAWLTNAGDGVYRATLYDTRGNATAQFTGTGTGTSSLASLAGANDVLARTDVRRIDNRYDLLNHAVDVSQSYAPNQLFLQREKDANWIRVACDPANPPQDGLLVLGDRSDVGSTFVVRYRKDGGEWQTSSQRTQWVDGYPVFNTGALPAGIYEVSITVRPAAGAEFQLDAGKLTITATPSEIKFGQLIELYFALQQRVPDADGLDYWLGRLNDGSTLAQIADEMITNPDTTAITGTTDESTLTRILTGTLGYTAGSTEFTAALAYWSGVYKEVKFGTTNHGQVLLDIVADRRAILKDRVQVAQAYLMAGGGDRDVAAALISQAKTNPGDALIKAKAAGLAEKASVQLTRLYITLLGRAPDPTGFKYYMRNLQAGQPQTPAAQTIITSAEFGTVFFGDGLTPDQISEQFVKRSYANLLGRIPTSAELQAEKARLAASQGQADWTVQWIDRVTSYDGTDSAAVADRRTAATKTTLGLAYANADLGAMDDNTQAQIAHMVIDGSAASSASLAIAVDQVKAKLQAAVNAKAAYAGVAALAASGRPVEAMQLHLAQLYVAVLGRAPDRPGFDYWMALLSAKQCTLENVVTDMLASEASTTNGLSDADFIGAIYQRAFNDNMGATTLAFWASEVRRLGRSAAVTSLVTNIVDSADPALRTQRDLFNNRTAAGLTYALTMNGNDLSMSRTMMGLVTATDTSLAINVAYRASDALAARAAVETATAALKATGLVANAAKAVKDFLDAGQSLKDAQQAADSTPMAKQVLMAAKLYVALLNRSGPGMGGIELNDLVNLATKLTTQTPETMADFMLGSAEGQVAFPPGMSNADFVTRFYQQVLHRDPDLKGRDFWVQRLAQGYSRGTIAVSIMNSFVEGNPTADDPAKPGNLPGLQLFHGQVVGVLDAFAKNVNALVKSASDAQDAAVAAQNAAGTSSSALLAVNKAVNDASGTNAQLILMLVRLYVGVLNRPASGVGMDYAGMAFYVRMRLNNQLGFGEIAQQMVTSAEGAGVFAGANTNAKFVNQIYLQVLGRPADSQATFWTSQLDAGKSRGQIAYDIIDSLVNHTYPAASEYLIKAAFDQRVANVASAFSTASGTINGINAAPGNVTVALTALQAAQGRVANAQRDLDNANAATPQSDPYVLVTSQEYSLLSSATSGSLQELLIAFRGPVYAGYLLPMLRDLQFGRTSLQSIAGSFAPPLNDKRDFFTGLYAVLLARAPDDEGFNWWINNSGSATQEVLAYSFMVDAIRELRGPKSQRPEFATVAANTIAATSDAARSSYLYAVQNANNTISNWRTNAAQSLKDANDALSSALANYQTQVDYNRFAQGFSAAMGGLATIQQKAVLADNAAAAVYLTADDARIKALALSSSAGSWSYDQIIQQSALWKTDVPATKPDADLSRALSALAGANLGLVTSQQGFANADATTQGIVNVTQLYSILFGPSRSPSLVELNSALVQLRQGVRLDTIADTLIDRDAALTGSTSAQYINALYQNACQRPVDQAGFDFWMKAMAGPPSMTRGQFTIELVKSLTVNSINSDSKIFDAAVATSLSRVNSAAAAAAVNPDTAAYVNALASAMRDIRTRGDAAAQAALTPQARYAIEMTQLYVTLLGRAPEPSALLSGMDIRRQGGSLESIANSILASEEVRGKLPSSLDNATFVATLFKLALGRLPTVAESSQLAGTLNAGQVTRGGIVTKLIADTYAYDGADPTVLAGRELLLGKVQIGLDAGADGLQKYLQLAGDTNFDNALIKVLSAATLRSVERYRTVLDSTTTAAPVLHTTPDRMTVDRWGNTLSTKDLRNPNWVTTYTYNANNQVLETTLPQTTGGILKRINAYDAVGHVSSTTERSMIDGVEHKTSYDYDDKGVLVKETHADGGYITYATDSFGQRNSSSQYLDASQSVTYSYAYDKLGNLVRRTSAPVVVYAWDEDTATQLVSNTRRIVDWFSYDELGRRTSAVNYTADLADTKRYFPSLGITMVYDAGGNVIRSTDANLLTTYRSYDAFNNKTAEREASTLDIGKDAGDVKTQSWNYDAYGRVLTHVDLGGTTTSNTYNGAGQLDSVKRTAANASTSFGTTYTYESGTGNLVTVDDKLTQQLTRYSYDRNGNRVTEQTWLRDKDGVAVRLLQNNVLGYDARNQLTDIKALVTAADYSVHYGLDAFGNRLTATTTFTNDIGDAKSISINYQYDAMNRVKHIDGAVNTTYRNKIYVPPKESRNKYKDPLDDVPDDVLGQWKAFDNKNIDTHDIQYDWAGNRTVDNAEMYRYDALGRLDTISKNGNQTGFRHYDMAGRVMESRDGDDFQRNKYDDGGRIVSQVNRGWSDHQQHSYITYEYDTVFGSLSNYKTQGASGAKWQTTVNTYKTLADTRLMDSTKVWNDNNTQTYKINLMSYDIAGNMTQVIAKSSTGNNIETDDAANTRSMTSDYTGHVLEKTQNGLVMHTLLANTEVIGNSSAAQESFSTVYEGVSSASRASTSAYVVQSSSETLQSIAKAIFGDERLWYAIADANGLTTSSPKLTAGQSLTIPPKGGTTFNGASTFKPYNAADIIGSTTPEMALPVPQQSKGGCGVVGQLIMVVVAVAVSIYTAGAAAYMFGATASGAIGAAAGSIASQLVGNAIGAQDGFSWKAVALSAIGGGISAGVNLEVGDSFGKGLAASVGKAVLSNVATQGVAIVTGLQHNFQWRSVVASAAGSAAGYGMGKLLEDVKIDDFFKRSAAGFAAGTAAAVSHGGKIDIVRVATDAFGNALGNSLASATKRRSDDPLGDFINANAEKWSAIPVNAPPNTPTIPGMSAMLNGLGYATEAGEPQFVKTAQAGGHFYLPALIANAAGISDERLSRIIAFSQFPDQISATDGFTNGTRDLAAGNDYAPAATGLVSERALHALNGMPMQTNLDFYQTVIAENRDNDAVAGIALHGLVDSIFHSYKDDSGVYRTYEAPLGHGAHGSEPDFISPDQARAATGQIMAAFETISGNPLSDDQRTSVYNALNTALNRAAARTAQEVGDLNRWNDMYGPGFSGSYIDPNERTELNFRNVVKEMVPNIPGVKLENLPSPFFRGPITEQGTLAEGRTFFSNLPPEQADTLTKQGMDAADLIMNKYKDVFNDQTVPHTVRPGDLYDTKVWSLRKALPWLNQLPQKTPTFRM